MKSLSAKSLEWVASAKKDLLAMPSEVVDVFGFALHLAQLVANTHKPNRSKALVLLGC